MSENVEILNEEIMMERGKFVANGHTFSLEPIFLGEEDAFTEDIGAFYPIPMIEKGLDSLSEEELGQWAIALFSKKINGEPPKKKKIKNFFNRIFKRKDYRYYDNVPAVQALVKWIEKKLKYKGRKVKFYQLERKFGLSKADIERLFIKLYQISFFPTR